MCWPSSGDSSLHGKISLTTSSSPDGLWQLTLAILANDTTFALAKQQKSSALAFHWLQPPLHQAKSPLFFLKFQVPGSPTFSTLMAPSWLSQPTWAFPSD